MRNDASLARVGLTVLLALVVLGVGILVIGERSFLFKSTDSYSIMFENTSGLAQGSPVQLNGVVVGRVEGIDLSGDVEQTLLRVRVEIESKYRDRLRADSVARIKSLGLLGDKFVQVVSGSSDEPVIEPGGEIPADQPTDVDSLIRSGEDVADYVVSTARSLTAILGRLERGEGTVGGLLADDRGATLITSLEETLSSLGRVAKRLEQGEGTAGRLLTDDQLAERLDDSVGRVQSLLERATSEDSALGLMLDDAATRDSLRSTVTGLEAAVADLGATAKDLRERRGLANRLITDEEYAERILSRLDSVLGNLDDISTKIGNGDGTVARLINEPELYEALNDIVVGINESRMLRWLIRNRQKAASKSGTTKHRGRQTQPAEALGAEPRRRAIHRQSTAYPP